MKKKILFIISNLESGGVSKSMTSLLNVVDTNRYDVDVLIVNPTGIFLELLPENIRILSDFKTQLFFSKFPHNLILLVKNGFLYAVMLRLVAGLCMLFNKGFGAKLLSKGIAKINNKYDLAVDYNGQQQLYYLVDQVQAAVKVSFFHSDYSKWDFYYSMDKQYYPKVDKIYTVSETCVTSLKKYFPAQESKIELFENISSTQLINQLALQDIEQMPDNSIVTIGHLTEQKGTLLALKAAKILKNHGIQFKWYFVGQDSNDHNYRQIVKENGLEEYINFVGAIPNPYPYIKKATIIVHLSLFEGKSIALDEAKLLCKPIVVSNFSTVGDQFDTNFNATITSFEPDQIAQNIVCLLQDKTLQNKYAHNLKNNLRSNENEIEKLYQLMQN